MDTLERIFEMQAAFNLREDLRAMVLLVWIAGHLAIGIAAGVCAIGIGAYLRRE